MTDNAKILPEIVIELKEVPDKLSKFTDWIKNLQLEVPMPESAINDVSKMILDLLNAPLIDHSSKIAVFDRLIVKFNGYVLEKYLL